MDKKVKQLAATKSNEQDVITWK